MFFPALKVFTALIRPIVPTEIRSSVSTPDNGKDENIISNVMLGISDNDFKSGGEYDLILGLVFA